MAALGSGDIWLKPACPSARTLVNGNELPVRGVLVKDLRVISDQKEIRHRVTMRRFTAIIASLLFLLGAGCASGPRANASGSSSSQLVVLDKSLAKLKE